MEMKLEEITASRARDAGLALVLILLLLTKFLHTDIFIWPAVGVLVLTMTWPTVFKPFAIVWFGISNLLGGFISKLLLTLLYVVLVVPVGLIRRVAGKDSMRIKEWKEGSQSVFTVRDHLYTRNDLDKPY